jgi:hypothetical protein
MKRAITIGINKYPSAPLRGCVNDAEGWARLFFDMKFDRVRTLLNEGATIARVTADIRAALNESVSGDVLVIHYSGHGTQVHDASGDESDGLDEAWVLWDGVFTDDRIADLLSIGLEGVQICIISDSCHSGSISRGNPSTARFIPGPDPVAGEQAGSVHRIFTPRENCAGRVSVPDMNHIVLTGARANESAWDTSYDGVPWGALSYTALKIIRDSIRPLTWEILHRRIRDRLPSSECPQHPQLEGPKKLVSRVAFK